MKTLKNKSILLLVLLLTLSLLLAACGTEAGQTAADAASASQAAPVIANSNSASGASASAEGSAAASSSSSSALSSGDAFAEAFSDRDLSGEYDSAEAVEITLNGASAEASSEAVQISGGSVTITAAGTYVLSGSLDDGSVTVEVSKDDKVQLVLNGVSIQSSDYAAIYVKQADKVFVTLAEGTVNTLANGGSFVQKDENDVDAVLFAKDDLTLNGTGTLRISSPAANGVVGKDEVTVTAGVYEITAGKHAIRAKDSLAIADGSFTLNAADDGLHAENGDDESLGSIYVAGGSFTIQAKDDAIHATTLLRIDGGSYQITAAEGLEATCIQINGGDIQISASDDGVNAAAKSSLYTPSFEMNGGTLTVSMGAGDTDGIDSNGNIVVNGGTINVTGQSITKHQA